MEIWQIILIVSVVLLILEMLTPTLFFINMAVAAFVCAFLSKAGVEILPVTLTFIGLTVIGLFFVRPIFMRKLNDSSHDTGMNSKYINQTATVVKEVSQNSGRVALYGEEWEARTNGDIIPEGERVKIISNDSLILFVEKI